MTTRRVAVVTGSNKGIGFAVVRRLCAEFDGDVLLTARDEERGQAAVKELQAQGMTPKFHQLDISSRDSCEKLRDFIETHYGGLDILVNNAGMALRLEAKRARGLYDQLTPEERIPVIDIARPVVATNFFHTLTLCDLLFPLLRPGARVVNVASRGAMFALRKSSDDLRRELTKPDMSREEIVSWIERFLQACQADDHLAQGWPDNSYGISKWGLVRMTEVYQRQFDGDSRKDIVINSCCPGQISTDMSGHIGETPDVGADTPAYLALLPPGVTAPRGRFLGERKVISLTSSAPLTLPDVK